MSDVPRLSPVLWVIEWHRWHNKTIIFHLKSFSVNTAKRKCPGYDSGFFEDHRNARNFSLVLES